MLYHTLPYFRGLNTIDRAEQRRLFILNLKRDDVYTLHCNGESAIVLISGSVLVREGLKEGSLWDRKSWRDEAPWCGHFPVGSNVVFTGVSDTTLMCLAINDIPMHFPKRIIAPQDLTDNCEKGDRQAGTIRSILDPVTGGGSIIVSERVSMPGNWGYPPENHAIDFWWQYNQFYPDNGFAIAYTGGRAYIVTQDTAYIAYGSDTCFVSAPGYWQYSLSIG